MAKGIARKGLRLVGIGALVIILLLLAMRLAVPVVGVRIANSQLTDLLGTKVRIGKIELALHRGAIALEDLRIQQPEGFGQGDLLVIPGIRAKVRLGSLVNLPVRIEEVLLEDARIQVVRSKAREFDLDAIISAVTSSSDGAEEDAEAEPQDQEEPLMYPIVLEEVAFRNLSVSYKDYSQEGRPYEAKLEQLTFVVSNLSLEAPPGEEDLSAEAAGSEDTVRGRNRASLVLRNIRIDQPPGFGEDPILMIPAVDLKVRVPSVFTPHVTVEDLSLRQVAIHLARNRPGRLNMEAVLSEAVPRASRKPEIKEEISSGQAEDGRPLDWKVYFKRVSIEGLSLLYTDSSFQDEPLEMKFGNVNLQVADLLLSSKEGVAAHQKAKNSSAESETGARRAKGCLVMRDVHIDQPRGFSGDTLLAWPELKVDFFVDSLSDPSVTIEQAVLVEPKIHLAFDESRQGNVNLLLSKTMRPPRKESEGPKTAPEAEPSDQRTRIHLSDFAVHDLGFTFTDSSYEKEPLDVRLKEVDLELVDLTYDPTGDRQKKLPATLRMTGRTLQKPFADAPFGLYAKIGTLGGEIPAVNGSLELGGLELEPMSHTLPPGTEQAIGGDALDLSVDLALAAGVLDCDARVKSLGGTSLSLHIGGTPDQPQLDTSNMLFLVFFRSGGALGSAAGKVGGAGLEVADTAVGSVRAVGAGTAKTLGSVGGGLLHTAKGLATADVDGIAQGLKKTTVGTAREGAGTAVGTVGEVKDGAVDVGTAGMGMKRARAWRKATQARWEEAWKEAQARVDKMPYPTRRP